MFCTIAAAFSRSCCTALVSYSRLVKSACAVVAVAAIAAIAAVAGPGLAPSPAPASTTTK